jgi:hypothetical protein
VLRGGPAPHGTAPRIREGRLSGGLFHVTQACDVAYWHIASFRGGAEFGRYRGIADMAGFCRWLDPATNDPFRTSIQIPAAAARPQPLVEACAAM